VSYQDRNLTCSDCMRSYVYDAEDQEQSVELGYAQPKRCGACWRAREIRRRDGGGFAGSRPKVTASLLLDATERVRYQPSAAGRNTNVGPGSLRAEDAARDAV
jgi:hypothetical protein